MITKHFTIGCHVHSVPGAFTAVRNGVVHALYTVGGIPHADVYLPQYRTLHRGIPLAALYVDCHYA